MASAIGEEEPIGEPHVPIRQSVVTFPRRVRYHRAADPKLATLALYLGPARADATHLKCLVHETAPIDQRPSFPVNHAHRLAATSVVCWNTLALALHSVRSMRLAVLLALLAGLHAADSSAAKDTPSSAVRSASRPTTLFDALPRKGPIVLPGQREVRHQASVKRPGYVTTRLHAGEGASAPELVKVYSGLEGDRARPTWKVEVVRSSQDGLPWIRSKQLPNLLPQRGTPPYFLTALANLRALGVRRGGLGALEVDIQSPETAMDYVLVRRKFTAVHGTRPWREDQVATLLRATKYVRSLESVLQMSGHRVTGATLYGQTSSYNLQSLIDWYTTPQSGSGWNLPSYRFAWQEKARSIWPTLSPRDVEVDYAFKLRLTLEPAARRSER